MQITLTGATGRIGRVIAPTVRAAGHDVRAVDQRAHPEVTGPVIYADLRDPVATLNAIAGSEVVVHFGNLAHAGMGSPEYVFNTNATINMNVFEACRTTGVRQVIFASSIQAVTAFGSGRRQDAAQFCELSYLPLDGAAPFIPRNGYALSKMVGEQQLQYAVDLSEHGMSGISLRLPSTVSRVHGGWRRSWRESFIIMHRSDAARLVLAMIDHPQPGYCCVQAGSHQLGWPDTSISEVYDEYFAHVPLKRPLAEMTSFCDLDELKQRFDWEPQADLYAETEDD